MHFSGHSNSWGENNHFILREVELFGIFTGIGGEFSLSFGFCNGEKLVILLIMEKHWTLLKSDYGLAILLHFLRQISISFNMHYFRTKIYDSFYFSNLLFDDSLIAKVVNICFDVPWEDSDDVNIVLVPTWNWYTCVRTL